ncbi:MAG TPA: cell division protein ZapA [Bacteroidia bacterium]|nr:cell division protein ZapA [Bacteroidia bacterium]HNT79206.1 cell division protein ZapA [Bacteroidia bacterium]
MNIKVNIGGRFYPLTVDSKEEESVRNAAFMINEKLKEYEKSFGVKDKQDLLAMCSLQFVSELLKSRVGNSESEREAELLLDELGLSVSKYLDKV